MTNPIETMRNQLRERFPRAALALDAPDDPGASWWLDVEVDGHAVTVEWKPGSGFGVSARPDAVFGERSDEGFASLGEARERVEQLLLAGGRTASPPEMSLAELRRHLNVSQAELARRLAIRQASISKMERREDLLLGSLDALVRALGGELELHARFGDEVIRLAFDRAGEDGGEETSQPPPRRGR